MINLPHKCVCVHMCACACVHVFVCVLMCMHVCVSVHACVCMCVYNTLTTVSGISNRLQTDEE